MRRDSRAAGLVLSAALALTCAALLASVSRRDVRPVAMTYKQLTMSEAIAAAKKIQATREVTSAYQPKPKIQAKHRQHRAAASAPAPDTVAPAPVGKHITDMTADQIADGTDVVFHDFNAKAYSSADAREVERMEQEEKDVRAPATAARAPVAPAPARPHVPVPADYARGLIVQPAHTDVNGFATAAAAAEHAKAYGSSSAGAPARSRRASSPSVPSSISSAAAKAQIYNNDDGVKVVTGTEGDNVASGVGGGVGGQEWVRARQARIAAARGGSEDEEAAGSSKLPRASRGSAHKASPPRPHSKARHAAPHHKKPKSRAPRVAPRHFDANFDNDANVKVVDGTEGDNVASGMGGGIDGAAWVAARQVRIAREGGVQSPVYAGANTYKGEVAYPGDQGQEVEGARAEGARRPTQEDIERTVGTNIVFHNIKNEGGIARGQARRVGIRYNDREMY